MFETTYRV